MGALEQFLNQPMINMQDVDAQVKIAEQAGDQAKLVELRRLYNQEALCLEYMHRCFTVGPTLDFLMISGVRSKEVFETTFSDKHSVVDFKIKEIMAKIDAEGADAMGFWSFIGNCWRISGFPRINVGHKLAASLMCTTMPEEYLKDLIYPWPMFLIDIPGGMIHNDGISYDHAFVCQTADMCMVFVMSRNGTKHTNVIAAKQLSTLIQETKEYEHWQRLVARYVVGVIAELDSYRRSLPNERFPSMATSNRDGPPKVNTYTLTRNVSVDCRPAIKNFLFGNKSEHLPSVQVLVRGHWRNQACGKNWQDRKWMHIEAYWKGKDDAPIAVRNHILNGK